MSGITKRKLQTGCECWQSDEDYLVRILFGDMGKLEINSVLPAASLPAHVIWASEELTSSPLHVLSLNFLRGSRKGS